MHFIFASADGRRPDPKGRIAVYVVDEQTVTTNPAKADPRCPRSIGHMALEQPASTAAIAVVLDGPVVVAE